MNVKTVKNGDWYDPSVWSERSVPKSTDNILIDEHHITSRRLIEHEAEFAASKGSLRFVDVDESRFTEASPDVHNPILEHNVGLYIVRNGWLNITAEEKTPWTRVTGSVKKGATTIDVRECNNWNVGDEIFICPTRTPPIGTLKSDGSDTFTKEFERRKIKGISGTTISIDPLLYDHLMEEDFTAEVGNLTRSFVFGGTEKGKSLVHIVAKRPQVIKYAGFTQMGPRQLTGVYALHMHHMHHMSEGTIVEGCAAYDNGFRQFVPHMSDGITLDNNVFFNNIGESMWYDIPTAAKPQAPTNKCTWTNNLVACTRLAPGNKATEAVSMGQGVHNRVNNNVFVYCNSTTSIRTDFAHHGIVPNTESRGAVNWHADNMGDPLEFIGNMFHSNIVGPWWWVNSPHSGHTMNRMTCYNNWRGELRGAYISMVQAHDCVFVNSPVEVLQTSGNTVGSGYVRCTFKMNNNIMKAQTLDKKGWITPPAAYVKNSPIPSGESNKFIDCKFIGYPVSVQIYAVKPDSDRAKARKFVDLIGCTHTGKPFELVNASKDSRVRIDPPDQPKLWGTGLGLKAEFFNDPDFKEKVGERTEQMLRFYSTWRESWKESPSGPYYKIKSDAFSVRFTGYFQPQYTGAHTFDKEGSVSGRLWVNDKLIMDEREEPTKEETIVSSDAIHLEAGKKYSFRFEVANRGGNRRCILRYNTSQSGSRDIPMYQLYSDNDTPPPPPPLDPCTTFIEQDYLDLNPDVKAAVLAGRFKTGLAHYERYGKKEGRRINKRCPDGKPTVDPCTTFIEADYLELNPDVAAAVKKGRFKTGLDHYNEYGKKEGRKINKLCK